MTKFSMVTGSTIRMWNFRKLAVDEDPDSWDISLQCIRKRSTICQGVGQWDTAKHSEFRHVPTVVELQSYQTLFKGFRYVCGLVPVLIPSKLSVFAKCHHKFPHCHPQFGRYKDLLSRNAA